MEYFHSACGEIFSLSEPLEPGDNCRQCGKPFVNIVLVRCQCSRTHEYITDQWREIGDKHDCPITGMPVQTVNRWARRWRRIAYLFFAVIFVFLVDIFCFGSYFIVPLVDSLFGFVLEVLNALGELIGMTVTAIIANLSLIGLAMLVIVGSPLVHIMIQAISVRPIRKFSQAYPLALSELQHPNPPNRRDRLPQALNMQTDYRRIQNTLEEGQRTIRRQQLIIGAVIIGAIIGLLICYLSINTVEEAQQVVKKTALIGAPVILGIGVLFYGSIFFVRINGNGSTLSAFQIGLLLSLLLGIMTVCTLAFLPPLLGQGSLSDADIAIGLTINMIGDVLINLFEGSVEKYWRTRVGSAFGGAAANIT